MKPSNFKGAKGLIIILVLLVLIVGYFYYLSNRNYNSNQEKEVEVSPAQELLLLRFDIDYPQTPKEVVKNYLEFTKVLHNEELTDEEIDQVALKLQELFDDELIANKTKEAYLLDMKSEITTFRENNYSIVNMYTSKSTDVEQFVMDGDECASLFGTFNVRTNSGTKILREQFILRKDQVGHWKILGFVPYQDDEEE